MATIEQSNEAYELHLRAFELLNAGQLDAALECREKCIALVPDEPNYLMHLADNLARLERWEEDLRCALMAAAYEPTSAESWALAGAAADNLGKCAEALRYYERSLTLMPNAPSVEMNLSMLRLKLRDYERGWDGYRWRSLGGSTSRTLGAEWDGSPIPGRTLFIWAEQGFGDTIQFMRYVEAAKAISGAWVVLEVPRELVSLVAGQVPADEIATPNAGRAVACKDFEHISLMSLPRVLGLTDEVDFWTKPYLRFAPLFPPAKEFRVGVCWCGNPGHKNDKNRSIPLEAFAPLLSVEGVEYYSVSPTCQLDGDNPRFHNEPLADFNATGRLLESLDLLITADTSVAHLAGAMGKPIWLLLPFVPDWRWSLERDNTPWYPNTKLARQSQIGDWASVVDMVHYQLGIESNKRTH